MKSGTVMPPMVFSASTATAPRCTASWAYCTPSVLVPGTATKRSPGLTLRESAEIPVMSALALVEATGSVPTPASSSVSFIGVSS